MKKVCALLIVTISLLAPVFAQNAPAESSEEKLRGKTLTLRDFGSDDLGFLSLPDVAPTIGVLIIHDSWGLDNRVRRYCDAIASAGCVALAVDLYNGKTASTKELAEQLQTGIIKDSALKTIGAGIQLLSESPQWKTEHVFIIAIGRQSDITLKALAKPRKEIVGMAWIEPEGEIDANLFKKSNLPLKIISTGKPQDPNAFLSTIESASTPERKKLVFIEKLVAPKGFFLSTQKSAAQTKARTSILEFLKACASGEYQDSRNVFQRWIDKLD